MGIYTVISGDSEVIVVFGVSDKLNVCGDVFALKDCPKLNNKRFPTAAKILYAKKMYPRCSSNYHSGFILKFDTLITLKFFKSKKEAKKDTKKDAQKDSK